MDEPFGPTVGEWLQEASPGKQERLAFICDTLGLATSLDPSIHYQLLHRTASAAVEAGRFMAPNAAMIVHSFSAAHRWHDEFSRFLDLFGVTAEPGSAAAARLPDGKPLYLGWAIGEQRFRAL